MFMPSAILESLRPKQAAQANADDGARPREKKSTDTGIIHLAILFTGN